MSDHSEIIVGRCGSAGLITLNRPAQLNAVTHGMVRMLREALEQWRHDDAVDRIVVTAAGGRAFSAGGDLRHIYEDGLAGRQDEALAFWRDEYSLNAAIESYPKPYIALIDGIVMGGGVGVSIHGSHRVAGDRFQFAMPEVGIGFFPDVGATWFLPRMPGETGAYCALTGDRFNAADGVAAGIATQRVASERFAELAKALCEPGAVDGILAAFAEPTAAGGSIMTRRPVIDRIFTGDSVENILALLDAEGRGGGHEAQWARQVAATIRTKAPLSLKIALAQIRRGATWPFTACLQAEYRIVSRIAYGEDFYEGIRAAIIDKDNRPRWHPASLDGVTEEAVANYFAPLENELRLP